MSTNHIRSKTGKPDKNVGRKYIVEKDEHKKVVGPASDIFDAENELHKKSMKEFREKALNNARYTLRFE